MLLEAALNGGRMISEHAAIPITPAQLAEATAEVTAAGADAVHFHVRDGDGRETLAAAWVARAVAEVRKQGVPFGISTGAWIIPDPERRLEAVGEWTVLPDFVSINFDEEGAAELAEFFLERDVAIEAGVANPFAADRLVKSGVAGRCLRIMFEPREQVVEEAMAVVTRTETVLDAAAVTTPRLLHGVNRTAWPLLEAAAARGYDTRIGFEDALTLPGGGLAESNGELIKAARERLARRAE
jgi:uncharacterized protein (DUF849 family)